MVWVSNYIHIKQLDAITHSCPDFNVNKVTLKDMGKYVNQQKQRKAKFIIFM